MALSWLVMVLGLVPLGGADDGVRMGQVSHEEVTRESLVDAVRGGHTTLALVELATPAHVARAYPVPGGGGKRCPPYDFIEYRGTVRRVVRAAGTHPPLAAAAAIRIVPANVPDLVHLSHRACVEGVSKSPIWPSFDGVQPTAGRRLLVFLRHEEGYGFLEHVGGAWLPEADLQAIEKALAAPPAAP